MIMIIIVRELAILCGYDTLCTSSKKIRGYDHPGYDYLCAVPAFGQTIEVP